MKLTQPILILMLVLWAVLSGCAAFNAQDARITLDAERVSFATEIAALGTQDVMARTAVISTVTAADATLAAMNGINQQLVSTLQRVVTPTPQLDTVQQIDSTLAAQFEGRRLFVKTGMSATVDPASGCVTGPALTFTTDTPRIYATAQSFNIEAGTPLLSRWFYENELVYEYDFVTQRGYDEWCFWFDITPDLVEFRPGSWSVRLYADGFQLEDPMSFTMIDPATSDTAP